MWNGLHTYRSGPPARDAGSIHIVLSEFANALVLDRVLRHKWVLKRVRLTAKLDHTSFKAWTDLYLKDTQSEDIQVLIDVKPYVRKSHTRIQEAAEIVALILDKGHSVP